MTSRVSQLLGLLALSKNGQRDFAYLPGLPQHRIMLDKYIIFSCFSFMTGIARFIRLVLHLYFDNPQNRNTPNSWGARQNVLNLWLLDYPRIHLEVTVPLADCLAPTLTNSLTIIVPSRNCPEPVRPAGWINIHIAKFRKAGFPSFISFGVTGEPIKIHSRCF